MTSDLRILFYGTPDFAVATLDAIIKQGVSVLGVVTAPDKPAGRGQQLQMSEVKKYALSKNIPVYQPLNLKSLEFQAQLAQINPNLQVVVAFRMLPEYVWKYPALGTFNVHASLLPHYRGAAPIHWAVIHGETETGVSTFFLKHEIDSGDIILQKKCDILPSETTGDVYQKLMLLGAKAAVETIAQIRQNKITVIPQVTIGQLKTAPKLTKENTRIIWTQSAEDITNMVRGLTPFPTAWTQLIRATKPYLTKILSVEVINGDITLKPGEIKTDQKNYLHIGTGKGLLSVLELQLEGKKKLKTEDFLRGFDFSPNDLFL